MTHEIKLKENFALPVLSGEKNFEVRFNDRGYQRGDYVKFNVVGENSLADENLVEQMREKLYEITYVLNGWGIEDGYVVFGIKEVKTPVKAEREE